MKKIVSETTKNFIIFILPALIITVITGLVQNPQEASVIGAYYYGYPFHFLIRMPLLNQTRFIPLNFVKDLLFYWLGTVILFILFKILSGRREKAEGILEGHHSGFLIIFLLSGFFTKIISEFIHEVLGHGLFVILFGGNITSINISILWPYNFSSIGWAGSFYAWQMSWIQSGGILVCLIVSAFLQALLLLNIVRGTRLASVFFWLSFWTFLNSSGYLIIGGINPFGDVEYLISAGILTQPLSLLIGLAVFFVAFFTLSWIYIRILSRAELINGERSIRFSLALFWLLVLPITFLALAGRGWSFTYLPLSLVPTAIVFILSTYLPGLFQVRGNKV